MNIAYERELEQKRSWYERNHERQQLRGLMYYYQRMMNNDKLTDDKRKEYELKFKDYEQRASVIPLIHKKREKRGTYDKLKPGLRLKSLVTTPVTTPATPKSTEDLQLVPL